MSSSRTGKRWKPSFSYHSGWREYSFASDAPHDADGEFAPGQECFHQRGLLIGVDDVLRALAQFLFVVDDGFHVHAHAGAFARGFDEEREFQFGAQGFVADDEFLERAPRAGGGRARCVW